MNSKETILKMVEKYNWLGREYCKLLGNDKPYKLNQEVFEEMANKVLQDLNLLDYLIKIAQVKRGKVVIEIDKDTNYSTWENLRERIKGKK